MKYISILNLTLSSTATNAASSCPRSTYPDTFPAPFNSIAVFGDSFSDVGNIHHASNGTQPGIYSYNGRYSDGRVWIEYIQQFFNLPPLNASLDGGLDFAYGGATVDNAYINSFSTYLNANVPSVSEQITSYLE
jgi:outer membrane lipase/esterase